MVSWQAQTRETTAPPEEIDTCFSNPEIEPDKFSQHIWWDFNRGWKSTLNNLRLLVQPYIFFNLIKPWLTVFDIKCLPFCFGFLIETLNGFGGYVPVNSG